MESLKHTLDRISRHGTSEESCADKLILSMTRIHHASCVINKGNISNDDTFHGAGETRDGIGGSSTMCSLILQIVTFNTTSGFQQYSEICFPRHCAIIPQC